MTAWLPNVVPNAPIQSLWGNTIRDRTVTPFASAAARTSAITAPAAGMLTYLTDVKRLEVYNGTAWVPASMLGPPLASSVGIGGSGTDPARPYRIITGYGPAVSAANAKVVITYPTPFGLQVAHIGFQPVITGGNVLVHYVLSADAGDTTLAKFTLYTFNAAGTAVGTAGSNLTWFAIGQD